MNITRVPLLVILVVVIFLMNVRAATISLLTLPLSMLAAVIAMNRFGLTLNVMSLGGLAIAIGALVDDAIIDVENVVRRLRENAGRPSAEQRPAALIVRDATLEIRTSIVFATVIIVLVFLPIFALSGVEGRLLAPLAFAYIVALAASLIVAIVVTPALCVAFLPNARSIQRGHDGWMTRHLKALFARTPDEEMEPNVIVLRIQPNEGITVTFGAKRPGFTMQTATVHMDFCYQRAFGVQSPDAYEMLLLDVMQGDATLFIRGDEAEEQWRLITPIEEAWANQDVRELPVFPGGSDGPEEVNELPERNGHRWRKLSESVAGCD